MDKLIRIMEIWARAKYDGHFTIMKFTTGWKVVFDTPHLKNSDDPKSEYQKLFRNIKTSPSLEMAILDCLEREGEK